MNADSGSPQKQIKIRLRTKFLLSILLLEAVLMLALILMVEQHMRDSILLEFTKRGTSITQSLATVNRDFVTTYNYIKIHQSMESVVQEDGLLYATVVLFDGEIISYRGREALKRLVLEGPLHESSLGIDRTVIRYGQSAGEVFCDIAVPIFLKNTYWGTVRAGFSLTTIQDAIVSMRGMFAAIGLVGLICACGASILLARRITRPIHHLVNSVEAIGNGEFSHPIEVNTHDEVGYLGRSFIVMQGKLKDQLREIAEVRNKEEQIRKLAYYDTITGLPNRMFIKERLDHAVAQARSRGRTFAVMFLDLDRFKWINDTLGHEAGDELLREVARRLSHCVRDSNCIATMTPNEDSADWDNDTVARLGGDEFVILLTKIRRLDDAAIVARRINQELEKPIDLDRNRVSITTSIGISGYPADGDEVNTLLKHADTAMYHAKDLGKNCYQFFTCSMNQHLIERLSLEKDLREALVNNQFLLHYQPKGDIANGEIVGMEALVRWPHPQRGMVSPADFIPVAEETGLIIPLGKWVLQTACAQLKAWQRAGLPPLRIAVNLSAVQFRQNDLINTVTQVLEETGLDSDCLELELTESILMQNREAGPQQLAQLRAAGVHLAIDDFGTGYSSLSYLKRFPINTLKIDRSFIRDIVTDPDDAAIVTATIGLGHNLRLKVVAEGVEDETQLEFLRTHKCDEVQGYFLGKPLTAEAFFDYMQARSEKKTASLQAEMEKTGKVTSIFHLVQSRVAAL